MPLILILHVGEDPTLLQTRSAILRAAGYMVESVLSIEKAVNRFETEDYDLILLCHSIPQEERDRYTNLLEASGSRVPVIHLGSKTGGDCTVFTDTLLDTEPHQFLAGIGKIATLTMRRQAEERARSSHGKDGRPKHKTILCVDDDTTILDLRRRSLENAGYCVLAAANGEEAVKLFSYASVDAVVLDYLMPTMHGGIVAGMIREMRPETPIFLVSGCTSIAEGDLALCHRYIPKGVSPKVLLDELEELFVCKNPQEVEARVERSVRRDNVRAIR